MKPNIIEENSKRVSFSEKQTTSPTTECQDRYPKTTQEFRRIQEEQFKLFTKKMLDYGTDNISVGSSLDTEDSKRVSLTGIWFRMQDKISRLKQLVVLGKNVNVKNESIEDTYHDLSVYAIIAQIVRAGTWGK